MWHRILIPIRLLIIPVLIISTTGQDPKNRGDVIVTYANHAEADKEPVAKEPMAKEPMAKEHMAKEPTGYFTELPPVIEKEPKNGQDESIANSQSVVPSFNAEYLSNTEKEGRMKIVPQVKSFEVDKPAQEDVVFVPNKREPERNEDYLQEDGMVLHDIMGYKTLQDVKSVYTTENTAGDIIFVAGKNHELEEEPSKQKLSNKKGSYVEPYGEQPTERPKPAKLDCKNLDCNNTVQSICGAKLENKRWRHRIFLNECYFRKVNCYFKNADNRFKKVALKFCKDVGVHKAVRPDPVPSDESSLTKVKPVQVDNSFRRSGNYRRSMSLELDGTYCSHPCPSTCPENYEPECAVTTQGEFRVFLNHCKLDLNSCRHRLGMTIMVR